MEWLEFLATSYGSSAKIESSTMVARTSAQRKRGPTFAFLVCWWFFPIGVTWNVALPAAAA